MEDTLKPPEGRKEKEGRQKERGRGKKQRTIDLNPNMSVNTLNIKMLDTLIKVNNFQSGFKNKSRCYPANEEVHLENPM